jgi:D-alanine-D-alanine ligase
MLFPVSLMEVPFPGSLFIQKDNNGELHFEYLASLDVFFPLLHGPFGEDGTVQGLLEMNGSSYVGSAVLGSAICMDKAICKDILFAHQLPVLDYEVFYKQDIHEHLEQVTQRSEAISAYPLYVKPANLGSSVGITKCTNREMLISGLQNASQYDLRVIVEKGIPSAREFEISVLGNTKPEASVPGEIVPSDDFYTYQAKYHDDRTQLIIPAEIDDDVKQYMQQIAVKAFMVVDCAGMARVDFLMDSNTEELFISEINTIPGFTPNSMYPKLWQASGKNYSDLIDSLIELALARKNERDALKHTFGDQT